MSQKINPLLFMPSPRDIPQVKCLWHALPYDKFIVKYKPQAEAYAEARKHFFDNEQYTHFVICADDLEIMPPQLETLLEGCEQTISGFCNLAESTPNIYDLQPSADFTRDKPNTSYGQFYMKNTIPYDSRYIVVDHCGSACRVMTRELFQKISFLPNTTGGWFDWGISRDLKKLGVPNTIDTLVFMWHRREQQKPVISTKYGYSYLWKYHESNPKLLAT